MFLTNDELRDLTGYLRFADQRRWLTGRIWHFEIAATGRPIVSRAYAESRMGGGEKPSVQEKQPNFASIRKVA